MLKTNKDKLVRMAVLGEVVHPTNQMGYDTTYSGKPMIDHLGMSGLKYNVSLGDFVAGWVGGEHLEPGLSIMNKDPKENNALQVLACIGNEVTMRTGDAVGARGFLIGKHMNFMAYSKRTIKRR